jgi:hypothetical protein
MTVPVASHPFLTAGVAIILLGLVVWVWRGGDAMAATAFAFVALLATSPWMLSWYSIWPLAFAAIARNRWPLVAVVVLQVAFAVGEVVLR